MFGLLDGIFDMNYDGKLDTFEKTAEIATMACIFDNSGFDDDRDYFGEAGLNYEELEMMDPEERDCVLEAAGLNPLEFDF